MGHQIAMLCALGGYETTLHDIQEQALQRAKALLENMMNRWAKKGKIAEDEKEAAFARLSFTTSLEEAVIEKLDVKLTNKPPNTRNCNGRRNSHDGDHSCT
jgi:3-hydroxybutyryl-CoA dehydrogenase